MSGKPRIVGLHVTCPRPSRTAATHNERDPLTASLSEGLVRRSSICEGWSAWSDKASEYSGETIDWVRIAKNIMADIALLREAFGEIKKNKL